MTAVLVVMAGRAGTGKSTLAKLLVTQLRGVYIRLDAIVLGMLDAALTDDVPRAAGIGYDIAQEVARENLELGVPVVVDGIHATHERREGWRDIAASCGAQIRYVETYLADEAEHRRRVEARTSGGVAYPGPAWEAIQEMPYEAWDETRSGERLAVDMSDADKALASAVSYVRM